MKRPDNLSQAVANVIYGPTIVAYGWVSLRFVIAGLGLYLAFMGLAYKMFLFDNVGKWPYVSRVALFFGPILLLIGLYWSRQPYSYSMLGPAIAYGLLTIWGGVSLIGKFNEAD